MSTLALNYIVNPFAGTLKRLVKAFEISGLSRAARELHRLGYYEEYKSAMRQVEKLRNS